MKKMAVIIKRGNPDAVAHAKNISEWLSNEGVKVYGEDILASKVEFMETATPETIAETVEAIIVLGGDGTMIYATRLLKGRKVPILGVNMGGLGFMTAVKVDDIFKNLKKILAGDFETEERMMLEIVLRRADGSEEKHLALNDAAIKTNIARVCSLETRINKEYVTHYRADGLLISTPTGSTAYALSAGGPILYPTIHSIIVVPICAFNLTNRPVVIPDWMEVEVRIGPENTDLFLTFDGQIDRHLKDGDSVIVRRAKAGLHLIKCDGKGYFEILRERLMWELKSCGM